MNENQTSQVRPRGPEVSDQIIPEQIPVGFPWRLLVFSVVIFAFSVFVYLGLRFGYRAYIDTTSSDLDRRLDNLAKVITPKDREEFITFYSQIVNLKTVLDKHPFTSNVFGFLEKNTIGTVYFNDASMDVANKALILHGIAVSFENVAQQMAIFERAREINSAILSDVNLQSNGVAFSVVLTFRSEVLSKPGL